MSDDNTSNDPEKITADELAPWLAYLAHEGATVSEGELSHAFGVDRIDVRDIVRRGGEIAERVRDARVARIKRAIAEERARVAEATGPAVVRGTYGRSLDAVRALLADGRPRSVADVAASLGTTEAAAQRRLYRAGCVRAEGGLWTVVKTEEAGR